MGFHAQWRISAAFLPQFRGMFLSCSSILNLWITLCADRIGKSTAKSLATQRSSVSSSARSPSRLPSSAPSSRSTLRKSASATTVALPLPIGNARRIPPADLAGAGERAGRDRKDRAARRARAGRVRSRRALERNPQCASNPVSAKEGGGRSLSPSGRLLGHSSLGSASSSTLPAAPHPAIEIDQRLGGCASGCASSSIRPCRATRHPCVPIIGTTRSASRARQGLRASALEREFLREDQGRVVSSISAGSLCLRPGEDRDAPRRTSAKRQLHTGEAAAIDRPSTPAPKCGASAHLFLVAGVVHGRLAARRDTQLGERLVGLRRR